LQLDQPYSPFVAESMLEPLVPLTRCPEFPESANVLPRGRRSSDVARADSVGDSSGQSSPRHEIIRDGGAAVASDPQQEQPQEIHVEIVEEVDDGDEPDGGPGAGSDSQLDEEEADRSSVDDAMDVAPLTAAAVPQGGDGLPTEDSSSGEDAAMAGIESSEQPSGDDEDEEDEELFEAAEFMAEDNALDDMPDVDLDEIG
ncbi:E3 ubiquitin-protein ligase, partial [Perkinsus olseni]